MLTTPLSRLLTALLAGVLLVVLAGCSDDEPTKPRSDASSKDAAEEPELTAGTCWSSEQLPDALGEDAFGEWVDEYAGGDDDLAESMRDDAAFSEQLSCDEPHSLELYDVVELQPALTDKVTDYADLLDQSTLLYRQVRDQVNDRCLARSPYGAAQRRAGGLPVQLGPSLNDDSGLHLAWDPFPADLWEEGQQKFVCTFEQEEPGTLRFADLTTRKVPVSARVCMDTPNRSRPCSKPHQAEDIAEMILNTAIEQGDINGRRAVRTGENGPYVALTKAEYAKLDKVCRTLFTSISTPASRKQGIEARVYPGTVKQWPTESGAYLARCFALKPFGPPIPRTTGSVFDRP